MFCNQCEQTAKGSGCTVKGVCGKNDSTAHIQDGIVEAVRQFSVFMLKAHEKGIDTAKEEQLFLDALFATVTNVNFDDESLLAILQDVLDASAALAERVGMSFDAPRDAIAFLVHCSAPNLFAMDANVLSAMQIVLYGVKGTAAYAWHASALGERDPEMVMSLARLMTARPEDGVERSLNDWLGLALECGKTNIRAMELLDRGNTQTFGDPEPTPVSLGHKRGPCILVTGHDLNDLEELLKQTEGTGVNVYTHGEMLPAHGYPKLKAYSHLVGHFGTAWQNQKKEFPDFPGPVLFTTNCIQNPAAYMDKIFTTGVVGWPGCTHLKNGDFGPLIEKAREMKGYEDDVEGKTVTTGFGRATLVSAIPAVLDAVKAGALRHVFLVGGCDGAAPGRSYYADFVDKTPADTLVLTLACGKFRFFDRDLGKIGPFPRLMDVGQCNDAYSAVVLALELSKAAGCSVNDLPLSLILSWYEQKAVCILLSLLSLGVKNIRLGPTLPAFVSPDILNVLVDLFAIKPIGTVDEDMAACLAPAHPEPEAVLA